MDDTFYKMQVIYTNGEIKVYVNNVLHINYVLSPDDHLLFDSSRLCGITHRVNGSYSIPAKFNNFIVEKM